jgi:Flp pilus assembly protein TadB
MWGCMPIYWGTPIYRDAVVVVVVVVLVVLVVVLVVVVVVVVVLVAVLVVVVVFVEFLLFSDVKQYTQKSRIMQHLANNGNIHVWNMQGTCWPCCVF